MTIAGLKRRANNAEASIIPMVFIEQRAAALIAYIICTGPAVAGISMCHRLMAAMSSRKYDDLLLILFL